MKIAMMLQTWIVLGYILRCTESLKTHEQLNTGINTKAFAANADANGYEERQDGYKVHQMATEGIEPLISYSKGFVRRLLSVRFLLVA